MSNDNRNNVKENTEQYLLMFFCGILLTKPMRDKRDRTHLVFCLRCCASGGITVLSYIIWSLWKSDCFMWRAPRAMTGGVFSRRLRAATGACRRLSMVSHSVRCRFATESCCRTAIAFAESYSFNQIKSSQYSSLGNNFLWKNLGYDL